MKTWKPTVAGILSIIAGEFSIVGGVVALRHGALASRILFHPRLESLAVVVIVLGIVAIVGGVCAISRQMWGLALAGAICALFPPSLCVLGILAIVFVVRAKKEFGISTPKSPPNQQPTS
jgi:uncharacterized membrane protein YidH (DUF202 family)